jgi:hypothetical protein
LWRAVVSEFELNSAELVVLTKAAEAADRAEDARAAVDRDGLVTVGRYGQPVLHPAADLERQNRALIGALLRSIGVLNPPLVAPYVPGRPGPKPSRRSR